MSKTNFIYIIPEFAGIIRQRNPDSPGWEIANNGDFSPKSDPFRHYYDEYKKTVSENGEKWSIVFRRYKKINAITFIIKNLNEKNETVAWKNSDMIFSKYRRECGVKAITFNANYALKILENNTESAYSKADLDTLYSEIHDKSELRRADILNYELKANFDIKLTKTIEDDIITILSLSKIAFYYISPFLDETNIKNYQDIIKAFWGYKSHLLRCQASQVFPLFFKDKMRAIDNLLDYRTMDLIDKQNKSIFSQEFLLENINNTIDKQNASISSQESILRNANNTINNLNASVNSLAEILGGIHSADKGILYLTLLVVFEIISRLTNIEPGFTLEFFGLILICSIVFLLIRFLVRRSNS